MEFEWDILKAARNLTKHGVAFAEAATVFADPLAITFFDPAHSDDEDRFLTFGYSSDGRLLVVCHTDRGGGVIESSAPALQHVERGRSMKKDESTNNEDEIRPEYHREELRGGVRGKYLDQYRKGTNLALLSPDVREAYPTDEAVNEALRSMMHGAPSAR